MSSLRFDSASLSITLWTDGNAVRLISIMAIPESQSSPIVLRRWVFKRFRQQKECSTEALAMVVLRIDEGKCWCLDKNLSKNHEDCRSHYMDIQLLVHEYAISFAIFRTRLWLLQYISNHHHTFRLLAKDRQRLLNAYDLVLKVAALFCMCTQIRSVNCKICPSR